MHDVSTIINEDELMHFGIKGQKWHFRRYQNPDGTLTEAGKKRYAKLESKLNDLKPNSTNNTKKKNYSVQKSVSEMNNNELQEAINRKRLEMQYNDLNKSKTTSGNVSENAPDNASTKTDKNTAASSKNMSEMSDTELQAAVNRKRLESQYKELTTEKKGESMVSKVAKDAISQAATNVGREYLERSLRKALNMNNSNNNNKKK